MTDSILHKAIRNNIVWCEFVANSHEVTNERLKNAWKATERMPPFYPNVITNGAATSSKEISVLADGLPTKCGWKDSFADIELSEQGFTILFDAYWYASSADCLRLKNTKNVERVTCAEKLNEWIAAWGDTPSNQPIFIPEMLRDNVQFLYRQSAGTIDSGLILNFSKDVVGITNAFGDHHGIIECLGYAAHNTDNRPLVGYGSRKELSELEVLGFSGLGKLRVWIR